MSAIELITRYNGRFFLNPSSMCARLHFSGIPLPKGSKVSISWQLCFDSHLLHPNWRKLRGAKAQQTVSDDGSLNFCAIFGPTEGIPLEKGVSRITLQRPTDPETELAKTQFLSTYGVAEIPSLQILPVLHFILKEEGGSQTPFVYMDRISLYSFWGCVLFTDAINMFNRHAGTKDFIETRLVFTILRNEWDRLFAHIQFASRKTDSHHLDDDDALESPILSDEYITRIILGDREGTKLPAMISREVFCGKTFCKGVGIWRVFQNIVDLVGRSLFIRQLFCSGQLYILRQLEAIQIDTTLLAEFEGRVVYYFRIPRSILNEPCLVITMYTVVRNDAGFYDLIPITPTPYITATQIEAAKGDPFIAFANLQSAHSEILKNLSLSGLLQPPCIKCHSARTGDLLPLKFIDTETSDFGTDTLWWTKSSVHAPL